MEGPPSSAVEHALHELGDCLEGGPDLGISGRAGRTPALRPASAGAHSLPTSEQPLLAHRAARAYQRWRGHRTYAVGAVWRACGGGLHGCPYQTDRSSRPPSGDRVRRAHQVRLLAHRADHGEPPWAHGQERPRADGMRERHQAEPHALEQRGGAGHEILGVSRHASHGARARSAGSSSWSHRASSAERVSPAMRASITSRRGPWSACTSAATRRRLSA